MSHAPLAQPQPNFVVSLAAKIKVDEPRCELRDIGNLSGELLLEKNEALELFLRGLCSKLLHAGGSIVL